MSDTKSGSGGVLSIPAVLHAALPQQFITQLSATLCIREDGPHQVAMFCPERECVLVGLAFAGRLSSWLLVPACDVRDAVAISESLRGFFSGVAENLGQLAAADAIEIARRVH